MRLRSFTAPTMAEAMRQIRETLGADAIIISEYRGRRGRGVQVTAAVEPNLAEEAREARRPRSAADGARTRTGTRAFNDTARVDIDFIRQSLVYHAVPSRLAEHLCRAAETVAVADRELALAAALDMAFTFAPLPRAPGRPLMLVGPPGVGKTVTVAKLAARATMRGGPVTVATTDTVRAGGAGQLAALAEVMDQPLRVAETPKELGEIVAEAPPDAVTLIDSPGTNPFAAGEMEDLNGFIDAADAEPVLVLAAGSDASESSEIAEQFADLGTRRMIVTRLDLARRLGAMLTAADGGRLGFSEVGITPFIGHGLEALTPVSLARILLRDPTQPCAREAFDKAGS